MNRRIALTLALALVAVGAGAGCATRPTMTLRHALVSGVALGFPPRLSVVMTAVVDVYNPNSYDVAIRAVRGTLVVAHRYPLPVDFRPPGDGVWLRSDAVTTVRVPVTIPVDLALALVRTAYAAPVIPFRITGRADVTATRTFRIEKDDYSFDDTGVISRDQVEAALRGVVMPWAR